MAVAFVEWVLMSSVHGFGVLACGGRGCRTFTVVVVRGFLAVAVWRIGGMLVATGCGSQARACSQGGSKNEGEKRMFHGVYLSVG